MSRKRNGCLWPAIFFLSIILFSFIAFLSQEYDIFNKYEKYPVYSEEIAVDERVQATLTEIRPVDTIWSTVTSKYTNGTVKSNMTVYELCRCKTTDGLTVLLKIESTEYNKYINQEGSNTSSEGTISLNTPLRIAAYVRSLGTEADNVPYERHDERVLSFIAAF